MNRYTIGAVAFVVVESLRGLDTGGFADVTIAASFSDEVPGRDSPAVLRVSGPGDLAGQIDTAAMACQLPDRYSEPTDRAWQLRQMAPIFSSVCERVVLHASGVQTDAGVVGFIGESGVGKSTLARSLSGIGCRVATDDLMPVRFTPRPHTPVGGRLQPIDGLFFLRRVRISWPVITSLSAIDALQLQIGNGFGEHGVTRALRRDWVANRWLVVPWRLCGMIGIDGSHPRSRAASERSMYDQSDVVTRAS